MKDSALLIIDYTYDFVAPDGKLTAGESAQALDKTLCGLVEKSIKADAPVFFCNDIHSEGDMGHPEQELFPPHNLEGTPGQEVYGELGKLLDKLKADGNKLVKVLPKRRYSAFEGTPLFMMLRERGIDKLVIVGVCTDICVLHTAIGAYNLGFSARIVSDAVATFNPPGNDFALQHFKGTLGFEVVSSGDIK